MNRQNNAAAADRKPILRRLANRLRTFLKFTLRNRWVIHGKHIRCPMNVWFWSPNAHIRMGDFVQFGPGTSVQCDVEFGSKILIGRNVAFVGRNDHDIRRAGTPIWDSGRGPSLLTVVEDDVWIGHGAIILSGVRLRTGCVIAAGSVVTRDVPGYAIAAGNPARVVATRLPAAEPDVCGSGKELCK